MKYVFGAETGELDKGVNKIKREMRDLNKVSTSALSSIGAALGVDVGKVQQFSSALQGLGNKLNQTGTAGTSAFGAISKSIAPVAAGIAGLGLAAAIAAFKQLNAEADAFERTIQGGVIKAQTDAYITTFRQALRDQSGVGEQAAGFRQTMKMVGTTLAGAFQSGFDFDRMREANTLAERAKEIAKELYDIDLKRKAVSVQVSQIDAQIAQQREIISDATRSAAERGQALATAQKLITDKLNLQLPLAQKQRDLIVEYNGLASTTLKDYDAEIAAKIQVNNLTQQEAAEQRSLIRQQKQINTELQKTVESRRQAAELAAAAADSRASLATWTSQFGTAIDPAAAGKEMAQAFQGNADLLHRPIIEAVDLIKAGWKDAGEGFATVFSSQFGIEDAKGKEVEILVTPILKDGTVLSPEALEKYVNEVLSGAEDILAADTMGLVIAVDVDPDGSAGERLHQLQEAFYAARLSSAELQKSVEGVNKVIQQTPPSLAPVELHVSNWAGFFKDVDGGILQEWPNGIEVGVTFKYQEGLMDMTRKVNAAIQSIAETTGSVIGQLVGDLATGGDAWSNFGNAAMSALGDMAISIGKIAIQAGIASLGIEAAITALGGPGAAMAIGAGVALVALGSAVKAGLSNVASGNYSAGFSVASGSYSAGNSDYETREVNVKVTGTLEADGDALVAVINNTNNKNYYTT